MGRTTTGFTVTQEQLAEMARERFGNDPKTYAFECPNCKDIASIGDFLALAGEDPDKRQDYGSRAGQECIGRLLGVLGRDASIVDARRWGGRGCDWAAYGLFAGPWRIVLPGAPSPGVEPGPEPDTHIAYSFALAPAPEPVAEAAPVDGRKRCPTCNAATPVRKDGKFRKHKRIQKGRFHMVPCEASGTPAKSGESLEGDTP